VPAAAETAGWPARQTRNSSIARAVDALFPEPPDAYQALRRLVGDDQFPQVFDALRPAPDLGPPPAESGLTQELADRVAASTVKVEGVACSRVQDGSGAVIGDNLVVTNAHVVAGEDSTVVERHPDGERLEARVVAFDPFRDLALLRVFGMDRPALPIADTEPEGIGAVFGHPGGGALRVAPFQVGRRATATGTDIYDQSRTQRDVLFLSASLSPGDSGAALVDPSGAVVGVAFAIAPDKANVAYALATSELRELLAGPLADEVDTGPCVR
jgi:S1-C subfamily serine protease